MTHWFREVLQSDKKVVTLKNLGKLRCVVQEFCPIIRTETKSREKFDEKAGEFFTGFWGCIMRSAFTSPV
jgi:hypothetical protein